MGGGGDILADSQVRQEGRNLLRAHVAWMPLAMEQNKTLDPVKITLLGPQAVVAYAQHVADLVHQSRGAHD